MLKIERFFLKNGNNLKLRSNVEKAGYDEQKQGNLWITKQKRKL